MATYTVSNAAPANFDFSAMFQAGAIRSSTTATTIVFTNPSGTKVVVSGAGFAFNGSGVATGGTISSIIYPAHARIRKSVGSMILKLSVTSSQ